MVWEEFRSAVRFPFRLPVVLMADGEQVEAFTINISNNGVLLEVPRLLENGATVEFLLEVPKEVMESEFTAAIHCAGHVIRSYHKNDCCYIAAVIDDYRFQ